MAPRSLEKLKTKLMQNLSGVTNKPYYGLIMSVVFSGVVNWSLLSWVGWGWVLYWVWVGSGGRWGGVGRFFEAGRLLTFSAFRMGAYSRWALIRGWTLIRINTVNCRPSFILPQYFGVYLGIKTCELFLCFPALCFRGSIVLTSLFSLFYVTGWVWINRFLYRGWEVLHRRLRLYMRGVRWA